MAINLDQYLTNPGTSPISILSGTPGNAVSAPPPVLPDSLPTTVAAAPSQASQVNGPFKTHGVLGDILGHIMDVVLVGAGLSPEYGPRVQRAKQADAIAGFQNAADGGVAQADAAGYPDLALKLDTQKRQDDAQAAQAVAEAGRADYYNAQADQRRQLTPLLVASAKAKASMAAKSPIYSLAYSATPGNLESVKAHVKDALDDLGEDSSDIDDMDDEELRDWARQGIDPATQTRIQLQRDLGEARIRQGDARVSIAAGRAANQNSNENARTGLDAQRTNNQSRNIDSEIAARADRINNPGKYSKAGATYARQHPTGGFRIVGQRKK